MLIHANILPFKAHIREDVLYDMDSSKENSVVPCQVIGVSSYSGSSPTFQVIVEGSSLFSYIPPHLLSLAKTPVFTHSLRELVYHNCPSAEFAVCVWDILKGRNIGLYLKSVDHWTTCNYLFTLDWFQENDLLHCVILANGQVGFFPQHKLLLSGNTFKPYKKLHKEWSV